MKKEIQTYKVTRDSRPSGAPKPAKPNPYPLHGFIEKEDSKGLKEFLNDNQDSPPLMLACGQGQIECVKILIKKRATRM